MLIEQLKIWRPFINDSLEESSKLFSSSGTALEIGPSRGNPEQDSRYEYNPLYSFFKDYNIKTGCIGTEWADYKLDICNSNSITDEMKNQFDLIFLIEVLEHTQQPWKVEESCLKMLKNGGSLIVSTPCFVDYHPSTYGDYWRFLNDSHKLIFPNMQLILEKKCGRNEFPYGIFSIFKKN